MLGLITLAGYAAQDAGNNPQQPVRRGTGMSRGIRRGTAPARQGVQYVETDGVRWLVHDVNRPAPPIITPGTESTQDTLPNSRRSRSTPPRAGWSGVFRLRR